MVTQETGSQGKSFEGLGCVLLHGMALTYFSRCTRTAIRVASLWCSSFKTVGLQSVHKAHVLRTGRRRLKKSWRESCQMLSTNSSYLSRNRDLKDRVLMEGHFA